MISDIDARQSALDSQRSFIVQAPAGSGKTGLLVYRMLTLLATVTAPQQVLAITFTRKATAEMRERLVELLRLAEKKERSDNIFEQQGIDLAQAVLNQDEKYSWRLLDTPHQLQILTIDAFCAKLTGSMPWLSRLGDRPQTTDQVDQHYAAAIEQLFSELLNDDSSLAPALQTVMLELDFNYNRARTLFSSMLAKRDQWLRHLVQIDLTAMRQHLEQAWQTIVTQQLEVLRTLLPHDTVTELVDLAVYAAPNLVERYGDARHLAAFLDFELGSDLQAEHWQALANMLLTGASMRKQVSIVQGFEAKTPSTLRMKELLLGFADDAALINALLETRELPETRFSDADWQQLLALEKVLKALAALLQLRFRASGECDHSEVTQRANLALQELDKPTDLGLRMDHHLQHILVDEFQDTSHGQIELLKKLTLGWGSDGADVSDHKTLFLVGDPMQSIYRFREADVSLFLQVADNANTAIFPNLEIHSLNLTENFRSSFNLVTWFNTTFGDSFPKNNDVLSGAISYAAATCGKADSARAYQLLLAESKEQEAELLLIELREALKNLPGRQDKVAILVRARSQLEAILPALNKAGIAYTGIDIQRLAEQQSIIDVVALCKAICRLDDRVSWLALLRGPWCGLTLTQIRSIVARQDRTIWAQLLTAAAFEDRPTQLRLERFIKVIDEALAQQQKVPLASLTRWAWNKLGGPDTLIDSSISDVETVFNLIENLERGGDIDSVREIDKALQGVFAQAQKFVGDKEPQVVVSTMHKAKGLQYHTVILPSLASSSVSNDKEVLMWSEAQASTGQSNLLLAPLSRQKQSKQKQGRHYEYLRHLDAKRSANESVRLMYVATTRAEQKLVLLATVKFKQETREILPPKKGTLLATVWETLQDKFNLYDSDVPLMETDELLPQTLFRLADDYARTYPASIDWQFQQQLNSAPSLPNQDELSEYDWATSVAKGVGVILHDWLQFQGSQALHTKVTNKLEQQWRADLLALRVSTSKIDYALQRLRSAVTNIQSHPEAQFLLRDYPEQQNEIALSTVEDGQVKTYRIDRTFIDDEGVRWVVDYKSTPHDRGDSAAFAREQVDLRHKPQLQKYGALFQQLDSRSIKLAVYFPLLKELVTWAYVPDD